MFCSIQMPLCDAQPDLHGGHRYTKYSCQFVNCFLCPRTPQPPKLVRNGRCRHHYICRQFVGLNLFAVGQTGPIHNAVDDTRSDIIAVKEEMGQFMSNREALAFRRLILVYPNFELGRRCGGRLYQPGNLWRQRGSDDVNTQLFGEFTNSNWHLRHVAPYNLSFIHAGSVEKTGHDWSPPSTLSSSLSIGDTPSNIISCVLALSASVTRALSILSKAPPSLKPYFRYSSVFECAFCSIEVQPTNPTTARNTARTVINSETAVSIIDTKSAYDRVYWLFPK